MVVEEQEVATGVSLSTAFPAPAEGSKKSIQATTIESDVFYWLVFDQNVGCLAFSYVMV